MKKKNRWYGQIIHWLWIGERTKCSRQAAANQPRQAAEDVSRLDPMQIYETDLMHTTKWIILFVKANNKYV